MDKNRSRTASRSRQIRRKNAASKRIISVITLAMVVVIGYGASSLYAKNQAYIKQEQDLMEQLSEEQARTEEIQDLKEYTQTDEYVEEIAREKLGLAYEDEKLFQAVK